MASNSTFTIRFKLDGDLKTFEIMKKDADALGKVLGTTASEAKQLGQRLMDMNQAAEAFRSMDAMVKSFEATMGSLAREFNEADANETRLAQSMRAAMGATQEQVQAVIDLTDAQEELGVVDGQFQISAAQQLAKFVQTSDALQTLIPLMNDMAAQQYGLAASEQGMITIATQLGKVLTGQTDALRRSGYTFSDAQKAVLQYGTEAEKVAVLVEVVGSKVGGMNEELGKTDAGKMAQLEFRMGRVREGIGAIVSKLMPFVSGLAQVTTAANGLLQLRSTFLAFGAAIKRTGISEFVSKVKLTYSTMISLARGTGSATQQLMTMRRAIDNVKRALNIAKAAAAGFATVGIGVLAIAIGKLVQRFNEQKRAAEEAARAMREQYAAVGSTRSEIEATLSAIEGFNGSQKEEQAMIDMLNAKWGDAFGRFDSLSEWYDILASKVDLYCKKLALEIEYEQLRSQVGEDRNLEQQQKAALEGISPTKTRTYSNGTGFVTWQVANPEFSKAEKELEDTRKRIENEEKRMEEITTELASVKAELPSVTADAAGDAATAAGNAIDEQVSDLRKDLDDLELSIRRAVEVNHIFGSGMSDQDVVLEELKSGITSLIQKYGLEEEAVQNLIDKYRELSAERLREKYGDALPELDPIVSKAYAGSSGGGLAGTDGRNSIEPPVDVESYNGATEAVNALSGAMQSLSGVVGEGAAAWLQWMSNLLSAIGAALPQMKLLTEANRESATAGAVNAAAQAGASVAATPIVGAIMAVAAIASVIAALAAVPKFAAGGLAYGPTLGLFGEYPGAARNPEVVAPLDRLRTLLRTPEESFGQVEFEIRGDRLVGVLNRYGSKIRRS